MAAVYGSSYGDAGSVPAIDTKFSDGSSAVVPVVRSFGSTVGTGFPAAAQDGRWVFYSFGAASTTTDMADGVFDTAIRSFLRGLPAKTRTYVAFCHEPENQYRNRWGTSAAAGAKFAANAAHFIKLVNDTVADTTHPVVATVRTAIIFTAYHCDPASQDTIAEWWPTAAVVGAANAIDPDFFGIDIDGWDLGVDTYPAAAVCARRIDAAAAWASSHNCRWGATEFSHYVTTTDNAAHDGRIAWINETAAYAESKNAQFIMYWDQNPGTLTSTKEIANWTALVHGGTVASPPTVPTALRATVGADFRPVLTWTASTDNVGVTGYKVSRNGTVIATVRTPGFTEPTALPTGTYTYTVRATDADALFSDYSSPASVTISNGQALSSNVIPDALPRTGTYRITYVPAT